MSSIFTKIINREIPGQFIYEDDLCVAILDKFPSVEGQSLVILKRELDYAFDMTDEEYTHVFMVAKKIAKASDKALGTQRTCLVVEGFEVPHVHAKLYPIKNANENSSLNALTSNFEEAEDSALEEVAERIKSYLK